MEIIKLDSSYINKIIELQKTIVDNLQDKTIYCESSKEQILDQLGKKGLCVGVLFESQLIAVSTILFPDRKNNLGNDLKFNDQQKQSVCHKEFSIVHPNFRGKNLQSRMFKILEEMIIKETQYKIICTTVSPDNKWSLNNNLKNGMKFMLTKEKSYGLRVILCKFL